MVVSRVKTKFRAFASTAAGLSAVFGISPAIANSSADIVAPMREASTTQSATGDEQFRDLFSSWQSLDKAKGPGLAAVGAAAEANRNNLTASARVRGAASVTSPATSMRSAIPSRAPIDGVRLSSDYGMRTHPVTGGLRAHKGIDLAAPIGTPIFATADGVVSKAEWFGSYGLYVSLQHGSNLETRYAHMSRLNVASGQRVRRGDIVGFVGSTGRSTGPHLHYEVRVDGVAVNPLPYMQSDEHPRLAAN